MRLSDLIFKAQQAMQLHGDMTVNITDEDQDAYGTCAARVVSSRARNDNELCLADYDMYEPSDGCAFVITLGAYYNASLDMSNAIMEDLLSHKVHAVNNADSTEQSDGKEIP